VKTDLGNIFFNGMPNFSLRKYQEYFLYGKAPCAPTFSKFPKTNFTDHPYTGSGYGAGGNGGQGFIVITYVSSTPVNNSNKFLVKLKNSGVAGHIPSTLAPGEIAINYVDNLIYAANSSNVVSVIASVVPQTANSFSTNSTTGSATSLHIDPSHVERHGCCDSATNFLQDTDHYDVCDIC
jgi:hypothetical protein